MYGAVPVPTSSRLKTLLEATNLFTPSQVEEWLIRLRENDGALTAAIAASETVREDVFLEALAKAMKVPFMRLGDAAVPEDVLAKIPPKAVFQYTVIPVALEDGGRVLRVATSEPFRAGLADALRQREEMHSTAMDIGVAILHPRRPMPDNTGEPFVLLGVSPRGIPFGGGFGNLTDIFFLVCAIDDKTHLRLLAEIARLLKRPGFLDQLRECETVADIVELIRS